MKDYETTFIVNSQLESDKIEGIIKRVESIITEDKGIIKSTEQWGRKKLAYPIAKQQFGFYVHIQFKAPSTVIAKLEREYKLNESILRYLTVKTDKKVLKLQQMEKALVKEQEQAVEETTEDAPVEEKIHEEDA